MADTVHIVELVSQALLREYMHKKGYKATLAKYDAEEPRTEQSISSRAHLSNVLGINPKTSAYSTFMESLIEARIQLLQEGPREQPVAPGGDAGAETVAHGR